MGATRKDAKEKEEVVMDKRKEAVMDKRKEVVIDKRKDDDESEEDEMDRPLTLQERQIRCAERAAALGLKCDFVYGRLLNRDGSHWSRFQKLADSDEDDNTNSAAASTANADPDHVAKAAEATMSWEQFMQQRSRAISAPIELAPVSEDLQKKIAEAKPHKTKMPKVKRKGKYDYDPIIDGESLSSSEEEAMNDELD